MMQYLVTKWRDFIHRSINILSRCCTSYSQRIISCSHR